MGIVQVTILVPCLLTFVSCANKVPLTIYVITLDNIHVLVLEFSIFSSRCGPPSSSTWPTVPVLLILPTD